MSDSLTKVKSCNALLCMLLVCIHSYLKSALSYTFLILFTCHLDTLYLHEVVCEIHGYFPKPKLVCEQKSLGNIPVWIEVEPVQQMAVNSPEPSGSVSYL